MLKLRNESLTDLCFSLSGNSEKYLDFEISMYTKFHVLYYWHEIWLLDYYHLFFTKPFYRYTLIYDVYVGFTFLASCQYF